MSQVIDFFILILIILVLSAGPASSAQFPGFIPVNPVFATTGMPLPTVTPEPDVAKPKGAHEHIHGGRVTTGSESFDELFDMEYENQPWRVTKFPVNLFLAGIAMLIFNTGMALALWQVRKKKLLKAVNSP